MKNFTPDSVLARLRCEWLRSLKCIGLSCTKCLCALFTGVIAFAAPSECFAIKVTDAETGRGVPLVELRTVNQVSHWTDSNGLVAFLDPGLMDHEVYFHVRSDGYEYPKDGFDNRGVKLKIRPGGTANIKLKRTNIAERLYRVTGGGIYLDTILLGQNAPLKHPLLNGQVFGQDTVITALYRGKIHWFWGDTDRPSYPLGNFGASGATSELPGHGGLAPGVGVDLEYFTDKSGFSRPMCPDEQFGKGLKWIEGVMTVPDETGKPRLFARVAAGAGLGPTREWHLGRFNDEKGIFESVTRWDIHDGHDSSHSFYARVDGVDYVYLYPNFRVRADAQALRDLGNYEAFTCVAGDGKLRAKQTEETEIERDASGKIRYSWKRGADRLEAGRMRMLISTGKLRRSESWLQLIDVDSGEAVDAARGSVFWNEYLKKWLMIYSGKAGEIWLSKAATPMGPWSNARKIVTHAQYNFYNPTQHPFFDEERGRVVYFEGTYTAAFSGATTKTPRYDYNQIMYRVALDDPRLELDKRARPAEELELAKHFESQPKVEPIPVK